MLGKNGLPLVTAETDDQGRAPIPSLENFEHEKRPVAYLAQRDRDVSFLPFGREDRELNLSRFDTSGLDGIKPEDLVAFLFTDRGIYRPGDTVKLGLILKQHNWRGNLAGVPVELDVTDPRGQQVESKVLNSDAVGLLESTFATRETTLTGAYQADCYLIKDKDDKTLLGEASFQVKEFLPDPHEDHGRAARPGSGGLDRAEGPAGAGDVAEPVRLRRRRSSREGKADAGAVDLRLREISGL